MRYLVFFGDQFNYFVKTYTAWISPCQIFIIVEGLPALSPLNISALMLILNGESHLPPSRPVKPLPAFWDQQGNNKLTETSKYGKGLPIYLGLSL